MKKTKHLTASEAKRITVSLDIILNKEISRIEKEIIQATKEGKCSVTTMIEVVNGNYLVIHQLLEKHFTQNGFSFNSNLYQVNPHLLTSLCIKIGWA